MPKNNIIPTESNSAIIREAINQNPAVASLFVMHQELRREVRELKRKLAEQNTAPGTTIDDVNPTESAANFAGWTSFGYPMLNSETELRPYIIQDAKGAEWTINSKGFYNNDNVIVRAIINGKEEYIDTDTNYANTDWIMTMIPFVEKDLMKSFSKKYGFKRIEMFGMNTRATSDEGPLNHVYSDDQLPNNDIAGCGLVYTLRIKIIWNDETEVYADTAMVSHPPYMIPRGRALFGITHIPYDILSNEQEFAVLRQAAEQRIKKLLAAKTL